MGVDVGGTFTDLVALAADGVVTAKVPSTPGDQSAGVLAAIRDGGVDDVTAFAHGMTVATNALLERSGARTALVTTEGFRDVIEIGRQDRPALYDLGRRRPPALVPRELRFCVRERMGPDGVVRALEPPSVDAAIDGMRAARVEAIAVCLLFAFLHPEHERRVAAAIRAALPGVHVSLSSEVLPEFREYERFATTVADAYLTPRLGDYLRRLGRRTAEAGLPAPLVMQSSGGVVEVEAAGRLASGCVLSGPAGGVVAAAHVAVASGRHDVLSFDMGGTSTDVAPIVGGVVQIRTDAEVAGVPIRHPMVDVHTVSAGGGSIAYADSGGALRVGPESAGADPGPAAYRRGGTRPTVTDANLLLGVLDDRASLGGGELVLDRAAARDALGALGERIGLDAHETARGVIRVANAEMARALRVISVERGLDPRGFALVAFGGAGGMHACALAEELEMTTVLIPEVGGVLSALGLAISDVRRDLVRPLLGDLATLSRSAIRAAHSELEGRARELLDAPRLERHADLRYRRQAFELTVAGDDPQALAAGFHAEHERRYGYAMPDQPVEIVAVRVTGTVPVNRPPLRAGPPAGGLRLGRRAVDFDGSRVEVDVLARTGMGEGTRVSGPAVIELAGATCLVRPGWSGEVDAAGTMVLERG